MHTGIRQPVWGRVAVIALACVHIILTGSCSPASSRLVESIDTVKTICVRFTMPDTLRVGTLYSPTSYFLYREEEMGYDYEMVKSFAADKGMALKLEIAPSLAEAVEMLGEGLIDMIAYEVPVTAEYKPFMVHCGIERITSQVLVQPKTKGGSRIDDVTGLIGRDVYVEKGSKYQHRLENLSDELGGGINIHPVDRDTLITEDLIEMVSEGDIPLTIVDSDIAEINKTYYNDLDITLEVSFPQRASWAVSPDIAWLADTINAWSKLEQPSRERVTLLKRYFERSKTELSSAIKIDLSFSNGRISPYDNLFKRKAREINWDWRLLAAQGYVESHFDSTQVSWAGARGMMQIMPSVARAYGLSGGQVIDNEANVGAAVRIIRDLDKTLAPKVPDPKERLKFIVAAYNSGIAHVLDAIALAGKHGLNPRVWDGNVAEALMLKSKAEYYNDPVCKYGYFRGRQTYDYVRAVFTFYEKASSKVPK